MVKRSRFLLIVLMMVAFGAIVSSQPSAFGEKIVTDSYDVSREKVERTLTKGTIFEDFIEVSNKKVAPLRITFTTSGDISGVVSSEESGIAVEPQNSSRWYFQITAREVGEFEGSISTSGDVEVEIPVNITIIADSLNPVFLMEVLPREKQFFLTSGIEFSLEFKKLKPVNVTNISLSYFLVDSSNRSIELMTETMNLPLSVTLPKKIPFPEEAQTGYHELIVVARQDGKEIVSRTDFIAVIPLMQRKLFGFIPVWLIFIFFSVLAAGALTFYLIRRHILSKQKYKMALDMKSIPKEDKSFLWLGKIAEKKNGAYLDPHRLTTHAIVAGATGGGKSISAQVIIEEALKHNICVIVFDPTAQWSGMLRKCEDKKMMSFYPKFGLKPGDARGFPGNIRAIKDARQVIDVEKYFEPGHIQILTLNKLQPKDMDIVVANVIRQIFEADPKEYPTLRTLLVFDEIHRILPKFGGSGEGFVQIERACREFRKWGYGVMLISQVLSDFAGQIKANISTEVQMRTRDEGDLNRIKTKYGEEFLQSLVKASAGVGMFVNPAYNHANPYFVNFRPILHNTRRLTDEELDQYNQYNDQVDDLEYQIEQLEELKVDAFDLKMELKLVKDKIMTGNFSVVDIYLEGLKPRIAKQWDKLGKTPKKREVKLVSLEEIKKSVEEAKAASEEEKAKENAEKKASEEAKKDPMEELDNKVLNPLTLDNGAMISTLKEMKNLLPTLDDEVFKVHANADKNEFAAWFEQVDKEYGARLKSVTEKDELIKQINAYKPAAENADTSKGDETESKEGDNKEAGNSGTKGSDEAKPTEEKKEEPQKEGDKPGEETKKEEPKPEEKPTEEKPGEKTVKTSKEEEKESKPEEKKGNSKKEEKGTSPTEVKKEGESKAGEKASKETS